MAKPWERQYEKQKPWQRQYQSPATQPAPETQGLTEDFKTSVRENIGGMGKTLANVNAGFLRGAATIGDTLLRGANALAPPIVQAGLTFNRVEPRASNAAKMDEAMRSIGADTESLAYGAGRLGAEISGTAGIPGVLAAGARTLPRLSAIVPYLETAGFSVKGADKLPGIANAAAKVGAGAAVGAATSAALGEDAGVGAGVGAVIPGAGYVAGKLGRFASWLKDVVTGRMSEVAAGRISREAAGAQLEQIKALNRANPDWLASELGVAADNPTYVAMLRILEEADPTSYARGVRNARSEEHISQLTRIAGGATATEARASAEASQRALNRVVDPLRETELDAANIANQYGPRLAAEAERFSRAATGAVDDVRRFVPAGERAAERAKTWTPVPGMPRVPGRYSYFNELAQKADEVADTAAGASLELGEARRFAESRLASLEAHGLRPLDPTTTLNAIRGMANSPGVRVNETQRRALENVAGLIERELERFGTLDARALYGIRKDGVNSVIETLYPNADAKAKKKYAAALLSQIKPHIDDAIERAGGTGWRDYLKTFETGMDDINRQKLGAKLLEAYKNKPKKFIELIAGNDPKAIEKQFGVGSYDVIDEMGSTFPVLRRIADDVDRMRAVGKMTKEGRKAATKIMSSSQISQKLPNLLQRHVTIANEVLGDLEAKVNEKTFGVLTRGIRSGKTMNELLETLPAYEKSRIMKLMANDPRWKALMATGTVGVTQ